MKCAYCGKEFSTGNPRAKYCSRGCSARAGCEKARKEYEARKRLELLSQKPLAEWAREARECNLDYGTYRALIEGGKTFEELKTSADTRRTPAHARHSTNLYKGRDLE